MCVAIFAGNSRVEDWKSGHRKLNSLFETYSIQDTILDRILLKTNFWYQDTVSIYQLYCSSVLFWQGAVTHILLKTILFQQFLLLSLCASSSCYIDKILRLWVRIFVQVVNNFCADVAYVAVSDLLYTVSLLRGPVIGIKIEHSNSFRPTQFCYSLSSAPTSPALFSFVKTSSSVGSTGASFTAGLL